MSHGSFRICISFHKLCLCSPPPSSQILAALPYDWTGGRLLFFSCLRVVFIPLFVLCVYPVSAPVLSHPAWPCLFSLLMGVTNGYFGSVPMIQAAGKVPPEQRELAGERCWVDKMSSFWSSFGFVLKLTKIFNNRWKKRHGNLCIDLCEPGLRKRIRNGTYQLKWNFAGFFAQCSAPNIFWN